MYISISINHAVWSYCIFDEECWWLRYYKIHYLYRVYPIARIDMNLVISQFRETPINIKLIIKNVKNKDPIKPIRLGLSFYVAGTNIVK